MVLYPNKLPESERVCSGICNELCVLEDVTDDLNRIFMKLAQPMNEIVNLGL